MLISGVFFFSSRRRHTRWTGDWSSDVCSSDLRAGCQRGHRRAWARDARFASHAEDVPDRRPGRSTGNLHAGLLAAAGDVQRHQDTGAGSGLKHRPAESRDNGQTPMYQPASNRYEHIPYARCGRSGLQLPRISLGLWQNFGGSTPFENAREMVLGSFDHGITHFDLANNYGPPPGSAEENFGRILATDLAGHRDELLVSTKAGYFMWPGPYGEWGSRKYLLASLDQSLERMRLDYVDIFYSHRFDPDTPLEETMGALDTAVRSGRALYV